MGLKYHLGSSSWLMGLLPMPRCPGAGPYVCILEHRGRTVSSTVNAGGIRYVAVAFMLQVVMEAWHIAALPACASDTPCGSSAIRHGCSFLLVYFWGCWW